MDERMNDTITRVNRQLGRIEQTIEDLMGGVELDEMSSKERLDLAVKLMGQQGRMLHLRQQCEAETPQGGTSVLMTAIMRQMRGEIEGPATVIAEK
ncbi:MAG: hypothetical protein JO202_00355 [Ktedonobacteraceae bacterium]|nr:hypothetical protein [Ktedonobacteraceae bacterium]